MIRRNPLGRPSIPYEPTDLRQMSATSIAVTHLEPMIRHADQQAETPIRNDAPTPA